MLRRAEGLATQQDGTLDSFHSPLRPKSLGVAQDTRPRHGDAAGAFLQSILWDSFVVLAEGDRLSSPTRPRPHLILGSMNDFRISLNQLLCALLGSDRRRSGKLLVRRRTPFQSNPDKSLKLSGLIVPQDQQPSGCLRTRRASTPRIPTDHRLYVDLSGLDGKSALKAGLRSARWSASAETGSWSKQTVAIPGSLPHRRQDRRSPSRGRSVKNICPGS